MGKAERSRAQGTYDSVGAGPSGSNAVSPLNPIPAPPLTSGGKPEVFYLGAEYCAVERWSVLGTTGAEDPSHFGLTWAQIAADLRDPSSPVAQSVLGAANHVAAAICKLTHGQPGNVCQSTAVTSVSKI